MARNQELLQNQNLDNLEIVAFMHVSSDPAFEGMFSELEIWDHDKYKSLIDNDRIKENDNHCSCCNKHIKYSCVCVDNSTGQGYYIGRFCAMTIDHLKRFEGRIKGSSKLLAEKVQLEKREQVFLAENKGFAPYVEYVKNNDAPHILKDFYAKMRRWGNLSERQMECWVNIVDQEKQRAAKKAAMNASGICLKDGKQDFEGEVIGIKEVENNYARSYSACATITKMTVLLDNGCKVWGTMSSGLNADRGDRVSFSASLKVSDKDNCFGFFNRPTKMMVV